MQANRQCDIIKHIKYDRRKVRNEERSNSSRTRVKALYERTRHFKETKEGVFTMCKMMEDMRNETAKETAKKERINLAKNS